MKTDLKSHIDYLTKKLYEGETLNKTKEDLLEKYNRLNEDYKAISHSYELNKQLQKVITHHSAQYRDKKIAELQDRVEAVLALVFPEENFGVRILKYVNRNKEYARLLIGTKGTDVNTWRTPADCNGGFVKQLISSAVVAEICKMRGASYLFFDEQFCSGDDTSVSMLTPFINSILDEGLEMFVIEHKPSLYQDIPRREIVIGKDRKFKKQVKIISNTIVD